MEYVVLLAGFGAVLAGALLFTNAVEWAGNRAGLGVGAVGTLLAGVSTALPESAIPVLAVLRDDPRADEVAVRAILGAPFMLATVAMALVGVTAFVYAKRRERGRALSASPDATPRPPRLQAEATRAGRTVARKIGTSLESRFRPRP